MHTSATEMHKTVIYLLTKGKNAAIIKTGDFMNGDITVTKIENIYFQRSENWCRTAFLPRFFNALTLFTEGEIEYHYSDKNIIAKKGDIMLFPGNLPYSGKMKSSSVAFIVLDFCCLKDDELEKFGAPCVFHSGDFEKHLSMLSKCVDLWNSNALGVNFTLKSTLYSILSDINFETEKAKPTKNILSYIISNLANPSLNVKTLCSEFFISESQLRRNMHKDTGFSPNEYIMTLRINKAKNELLHTNKEIKQIAIECGFASPYYFSRIFSKEVGIAPSKYRSLTHI